MFRRLRDLRRDSDRTQADVAEHLGLSPAGYAKIERGESILTATTIVALAVLYRVSADYILELTDDPRPPRVKRASKSH